MALFRSSDSPEGTDEHFLLAALGGAIPVIPNLNKFPPNSEIGDHPNEIYIFGL